MLMIRSVAVGCSPHSFSTQFQHRNMLFHLLTFGALALATSGRVQSVLHPSLAFLEDSDCSPIHVTMHVPNNGTDSDGDDAEHLYHINGFVRRTNKKPATLWTLERDNNYPEGWKIYWTHPNGNKQYWYSSGDEIRIGSPYSATTVYIKYAEHNETKAPELAMYWNDRCLNYGTEDDGKVWMTDGSLCENVILRNTTALPVFRSLSEDCKTQSSIAMKPHGMCDDYSDCDFCWAYERCCARYPDGNMLFKTFEEEGDCECGTTPIEGRTCN